jgi:hypothetical protein
MSNVLHRPSDDRDLAPAGPEPADASRTAERARAADLLAVADEALARALSPDSAAWLQAARQQGGQ